MRFVLVSRNHIYTALQHFYISGTHMLYELAAQSCDMMSSGVRGGFFFVWCSEGSSTFEDTIL